MKMGKGIGVFLCVTGLLVLAAPAGLAESEPNNTIAAADPVPVNGAENGSLTALVPSDLYDFYTVTATADGLLQVGVTPAVDLRLGVTLLDTDGVSELAAKDAEGKGKTTGVIYGNLRAGKYYIAVRLIEGQGDYGLSVNFAPIEQVDTEPNDKPAQALTLPLNKEVTGHVGFHGSLFTDRFDFYVITTSQNGSLDTTVYPDGTLRVALHLIDTNGASVLVSKNDNGKGGSEKCVYPNLAAGTYYVLVEATEGYGSYSLTNLLTPNPVSNDTEPDNNPSQAVPVPLVPSGDNYAGSMPGQLGYYGSEFRDERDFFRLELPTYGKLKLNTTAAEGSNLRIGFSLFDSALRGMGDGAEYNGLAAGTYYVEMGRADGFGGYTFAAVLETHSAPAPFSQPAADLPPNGKIENILLTEDVGSIIYKATLPADGALTIHTVCSDSLWEQTYLFHADGSSRIEATENYFTAEERVISIPDLRAGVYIVEVRRIQQVGAATLATEFAPAPNVDNEVNDCWTQLPEKIALGQNVVGHIGFNGNGWRDANDWFYLEVPDDGELSVTCTADSTLWYYMYFYDFQEGSWLRELGRVEGYYTTDPRTLAKPDVLAGKYLVRIVAIGRYGNYQFTVTQKPNRSGDAEYNDSIPLAVPLALGAGSIGHLGFDKPFREDHTDYYKVELPADGELTVSAHADPTLWYYLYLYQSDGVSEIQRNEGYYTGDRRQVGSPNLRAGTYYIRVEWIQNYGTYEVYTSFKEKAIKDTEQNNFQTMAETLALGSVRQGVLGFYDLNYNDRADWWRVEVPAKTVYRLSWQSENTIWSRAYLFSADQLTQINQWENYNNSVAQVRDQELEAGTYYILCYAVGNYGGYSLYFGDPAGATGGTLTGQVTSAANFPLAEIDCSILGRTVKTDFTGGYKFEGLPPGTYPVTFSSGAKYYAVTQDAQIQVGQTTTLNAVLLESNKTAPADVQKLYGEARDGYVHLFWTPSVSPDVPDGGGYKLFINSQAPMDLGNVLSFRSDGFVNGTQYTFRLTVYDKFGNESQGTTLTLDLPGVPVTPTPTPPVTHPTPTPGAGGETPTPTVTPTSGQPPVPTPTIPGGEATPTPIVVGPVQPDLVWEFDQSDLAANGWAEISGGFDSRVPGTYFTRFTFSSNQFASTADNMGLAVAVKSNEVTFLLTQNAVNTGGRPALIRAKVRSNQGNAQIVLGALRGEIFSGKNVNGTLGMTMNMSSEAFMDRDGYISVVYRPDSGELINPFIQVAGAAGGTVNVWVDRIELYILQEGKAYPGEMFW
ncbi:MAG: pre-peptidase C-terminal domain-containing protein [bacterium]